MKKYFNDLTPNGKSGFSLVELIVVIVILAILVGVTIQGVMGYVSQARINTDIANANSIASALSTLMTDEEIYFGIGKEKVKYTLKWSNKIQIPELEGDSCNLVEKMKKFLPDGLSDSKTLNGFILTITSDGFGNISLTCEVATETPVASTDVNGVWTKETT